MPLEDIIKRRITGIHAFDELPIDALKWGEAHNHHHSHRYLHATAAHRPGIVYGLEVFASATQPQTIVVAPGVGIDSEGRTIILPSPRYFQLDKPRMNYVVLSFVPSRDRGSAITVGSGQEYYRMVEGYELTPMQELPDKPYLELARIFRSGAEEAVRDAGNPAMPANNEISLLYRTLSFPYCYADDEIGELSYVPQTKSFPWNPNRTGLWNLLREGSGRGFHIQFTGIYTLRQPPERKPALLYMAGKQGFQNLAEEEIEGLRNYLASGGLLVGEACDNNKEFETGFLELAGKVGADLKPLAKAHSLLTAHYVFGAPPPGAHTGGKVLLDEKAGVLFGTANYGGAWQGELEKPDAADARERIRQSIEFGLNIIAFAALRKRRLELSRLDRVTQ